VSNLGEKKTRKKRILLKRGNEKKKKWTLTGDVPVIQTIDKKVKGKKQQAKERAGVPMITRQGTHLKKNTKKRETNQKQLTYLRAQKTFKSRKKRGTRDATQYKKESWPER